MKTMTVAELIKKLKRMPQSAPVFMLTDLSNENWDEDRDQYKKVHSIEYVEKENTYDETGFSEDQISVLLKVECE